MKKLLISTLCLCFGLFGRAQIVPGSDAPDFNVTDINGNTHVLSDYLAQGKTVILDISATWCGPCWNYHESGALEKLYYTYGPGGSNEVVVLFVEGDALTSVESLYGTNMPGDSGITQGDWTEHSPYPVIDSWQVANLYQINYFPTIFRICPDGKVSEVPQLNFEGLKQTIINNCQTLTDLQNHGKILTNNYKVCEGSSITPKATLTNYGTQIISNAVIDLMQDDEVVATKVYSGILNMFDEAQIVFDEAVIPPSDYQMVITSINGNVPVNTLVTKHDFEVIEALTGSNNITVQVHTNYYPDKISWAIKNSSGAYVANGGPYQQSDVNTTKVHNITLPDIGTECYSVEFYSSNGYGWMGDTPGEMDVLSDNETIFSYSAGNFGYVLQVPSAFKTNGELSIQEEETPNISIFPNPTTGILNVCTLETINITIYDTNGIAIFKEDNINNGDSINVKVLSSGVYIMSLKGETTQSTKKIIIK